MCKKNNNLFRNDVDTLHILTIRLFIYGILDIKIEFLDKLSSHFETRVQSFRVSHEDLTKFVFSPMREYVQMTLKTNGQYIGT